MIFLRYLQLDLVELLQVNLIKLWGPIYDWIPSGVSKSCPHWASRHFLITVMFTYLALVPAVVSVQVNCYSLCSPVGFSNPGDIIWPSVFTSLTVPRRVENFCLFRFLLAMMYQQLPSSLHVELETTEGVS